MSLFIQISRVQLRPFTKQLTRRQVTLRATSHRASEHTCQMDDTEVEAVPRFLRFTGRMFPMPCCFFHAS